MNLSFLQRIPLTPRIAIMFVLLAAAPLVLAFRFVESSHQILIREAQVQHKAVVRAVADRIAGEIDAASGLGQTLLNMRAVPGADPRDVLQEQVQTLLETRLSLVAVGLYEQRREEIVELIYAARRDAREGVEAIHHPTDPRATVALRRDGSLWLRLRLTPQSLDDLRFAVLVMRVDGMGLEDRLASAELGAEAEIALASSRGGILAGGMADLEELPGEFIEKAFRDELQSSAGEYVFDDGERRICAHARVAGTNWSVLSRQNAARSVESALKMQRQARWTALGVVLLAGFFTFLGWLTVVRPIRKITESSNEILGAARPRGSGNEVADLRESFERLQSHLNDRDELQRIALGRYEVRGVLGAGAMGTVFRGWDPSLKRPLALKTVKLGENVRKPREQLLEHLQTEATTLARLNHTNIVGIYDLLAGDGVYCLVMELVEGTSLERYIWRRGPLPVDQVAALCAALLRGLEAAHRQGVVHHDVKPANILLGAEGEIKLTDFGIAELLDQGEKKRDTVFGTPGYLPPEALRSGLYDERSDLFAAGVVIYEALTGRPPFRGRTARELIVQTLTMRVKPPGRMRQGIPPGLEAFVLKLMSADPADRPQSAQEAATELEKWMTGHPVSQFGMPVWKPELEDEEADEQEGKTAPERPSRIQAGLQETLGPSADSQSGGIPPGGIPSGGNPSREARPAEGLPGKTLAGDTLSGDTLSGDTVVTDVARDPFGDDPLDGATIDLDRGVGESVDDR